MVQREADLLVDPGLGSQRSVVEAGREPGGLGPIFEICQLPLSAWASRIHKYRGNEPLVLFHGVGADRVR